MHTLRIKSPEDQASARKQLRNVRRHRLILGILALSSLPLCVRFEAAPVWARETSKSSMSQINGSAPAVRGFGGLAISPDGRQVAWASGSELFVMDLAQASSQPQKIARGVVLNPLGFASRMNDGVWSPDSRRLAFIAAGGDRAQPQLCVVSATGGPPTQLTNLAGALAEPRWSPDGKTLGFLFVENPPFTPGTYSVIPPPTGVVGEHESEQRLAVVDLASGRVRVVSPPGFYVYEYDWSPDSKEVAATAAQGPGNDSWYSAQLFVINVDSGEAKSILKPGMQITVPRWSPDGKQIAFIGGLMSGRSIPIGDVHVISVGSGHSQDITPQMKATARRLVWSSSNRILFSEFVHGESGLAEIDITQGRINQLWTGAEFSPEGGGFANFSLAREGRTSALDLQSFHRPPEIWAGPIGTWKQITHYNEDVHPTWGKVESLEWRSDDWTIQGWLYYPRDYDPHVRYPMVVSVHGGPAYLHAAGWGGESTDLSSAGYFVLCPNFRGSVGEGEAFVRANVKDIGYGDLRDILAGVNKVVEILPIDKNRIGISGWSYGGYMTMWAVTQTELFHAGVAGAGVADWLSNAGQANYPQWAVGHFGASVYDDPLIYARSSPMNYIRNVKTPTLILVGAGDGVCPAAQSLEFWHALRALGVRTELVIYPDEGHVITRPEHVRDITRRRIEWFNEYLK